MNVLASLATMPGREGAVKRVIAAIQPQVKLLHVHRNTTTNNLGDTAKFWPCWGQPSSADFDYHVVIDDDLQYPSNFVARMVAACRLRSGDPVGCHAVSLHEPFVSYYESRKTSHFSSACEATEAGVDVDILGTNAVCYAVRRLRLQCNDFPVANMADIWFAIAAKKQGLRLWRVPREKNWLVQQPGKWDKSIYMASRRQDGSHLDTSQIQTAVVKEHWALWRS